MLLGQPIRQIAYFTPDVRLAAQRHVTLYGSGPYFVLDFPPMSSTYRGREAIFDHTIAVGQWGAMQVEFVQQNRSGSSIFHDLFPEGSGKTGLHHVALFVDDLESAVDAFVQAGFTEAARISPPGLGVTTVFMDAVGIYGHFVELYEPKPLLKKIYDMVATAAVGFDGRDPVRAAIL
jgi:hypothetical protein